MTPPSAAADVHPGGEVVLALSEESAIMKRTALSELQRMHQEVVLATRAVEVEVLGVVTAEELSRLEELDRARLDAESVLHSVMDAASWNVPGRHYEEYQAAKEAEEQARAAYADLWSQLFEE